MNNKRSKKLLWVLVIVIIIALVTGGTLVWNKHQALERLIEKSTLPKAAEYKTSYSPEPSTQPTSPAVSSVATPKPAAAKLPTEANLAVPFTVQAPHTNWDDPYSEFCEEASVLMAISYVHNQSIPDANFADKELLAIKAFEEKRFGYYRDTNAAETAIILREYYGYDRVQVLQDPTIEDMKEAVAAGKLVLVPAAGRNLGNPFFQQPGPLYHMLIIKGYTANNKFITNDPGTRRGADFLYSEETIMNAMHDWRADSNIELGKKVVLIVG